jgi:hypothetical protein
MTDCGKRMQRSCNPVKCAASDFVRERNKMFFNGKKLSGKNGLENLELGVPAAKPRKFFES